MAAAASCWADATFGPDDEIYGVAGGAADHPESREHAQCATGNVEKRDAIANHGSEVGGAAVSTDIIEVSVGSTAGTQQAGLPAAGRWADDSHAEAHDEQLGVKPGRMLKRSCALLKP